MARTVNKQRGAMKITMPGAPNSRQEEFFNAKARHIGYGGARG